MNKLLQSSIKDSNNADQPGIIIPAPFTPTAHSKVKAAKKQYRPYVYVTASLLLFACLILAYLFTAKSVVLVTFPQANKLEISGGLHFELADHFLMLPGEYQLSANLEGHFPLKQAFTVSELQNQQLNFEFTRLPGKLTLELEPQTPVSVLIDNKTVEHTGNTINNIPAGKRLLTLTSERFLPFTKEIQIEGKEITQTLPVKLTPAWANISFNSLPEGAEVYQQDILLGTTPFSAEVLRGEHQLRYQKAGYKPSQRELEVRAGIDMRLDPVTLFKLTGKLAVTSTPAGVSVTYGDQYLGTTPLTAAVKPDTNQSLLLFKDGYQEYSTSLTVPSGETVNKSFKLQPVVGEISFRVTPADALLYIDERLMGRANQKMTLPAKQQSIRIVKEGFVDYKTQILPNPSMEQVFSVQLKTFRQDKFDRLEPMISSTTGSKLKLFKPNDIFVMGASRREQGRRANEVRREINLTRAFYLGLTEVTNKEFRLFKKDHSSGHVKGNSLNGSKQPVVRITWLEAVTFCNWLSEKEQLQQVYQIEDNKLTGINLEANGYRLPTEAEWVWAARYQDGKMLKYAWGESLPPQEGSANIADIAGASILGEIQPTYNDNFITTAPVASFTANKKGLYDLPGNVAEWIHDYYQIQTGLSLKTEKNPSGPESGDYHVIRGASWAHGTRTELRLSFRDYGNDKRDDLGFRIARNAL
ncbi:SUMF1/EgtB/PvdO family nonheme iron enzyme [Thalassomonas viridans]|uniref:SUMF1/EgtB/PvdO family nonheme iron enzyme n=1 Tax=Thalassomonas viridans TaxID=137584 RepID=A0AAE9Z0K2_9GAMM|nr:SUMF1/EgtB/PvdO family nonheme iron enzyme [Thalassomonas viridans]WDE04012.1 SUMF1/EgtB/PvdO family nonheme iron enzyme [Thalassomonas viridans]